VTFSPTATGQQAGYLQVTDTAASGTQVVNLYGTGQ
jgi:hypothetical protein